MNALRKLALVAGGVAVIVALFFALRGRDEEPDRRAGAPSPAAGATTAATTSPAARATTRTRASAILEVPIAVRRGRVLGGVARPRVQRSARVLIVVSSDVADEVHLHGYDISRAVKPGVAARLAFRATLVGRFGVELEERGLQIAEVSLGA